MAFSRFDLNYRDDFIVENTKKIDTEKFQNLNEFFDYIFETHAEKFAFINMSKRLKFKHINKYSRRFASFLLNCTDLKPGDKVVLQMPNILTYPIAAAGILRAGMVVVNANPLYTEREMENQFNDSDARAIVAFAGVGEKLQHILPMTKIKHVIIANIGDMHSLYKRKIINWAVKYIKKSIPKYNLPYATSFRKALKIGKEKVVDLPKTEKNTTACLQYTGGTTGIPKGAILTHANLISNVLQIENIVENVFKGMDNPVMISPLPLYHIYSFNVSFLTPMYMGIASLFITDPRDINSFISTLQKNKFNAFVSINTLFNHLISKEKFRKLDFSNLVLALSGGMSLSENVVKDWDSFVDVKICEGYGMTETSPLVLANPVTDPRTGSIGYPIANTQAKIIDDDGNTLPYGKTGELCIKGPQVMQGYWNNVEETQKVLDKDGFLRTGDISVIDENRRFSIIDRKKDMINVSGFNVYPNEVEEVLSLHPDVLEVAVVGEPDIRSGESVKAFIVTHNNKFLKVDDLKQWCSERLAAYKRPKSYEFKRELPKSAIGKILRKELRKK